MPEPTTTAAWGPATQHNAALRNLANKLVGKLWWCLEHEEPWDESTAWPPMEEHPQHIAV